MEASKRERQSYKIAAPVEAILTRRETGALLSDSFDPIVAVKEIPVRFAEVGSRCLRGLTGKHLPATITTAI